MSRGNSLLLRFVKFTLLTPDAFPSHFDQVPDAVFALLHALQQNVVLLEQNAALSARFKAFEDRLDTDSHNSSKPPAYAALPKNRSR